MTKRVVATAVAVAALVAAAEAAAAASISVRPTSSPPGRLVTVTGRGFCPTPGCSRVRIFVFGNPVADDVRVTASGTFVRRVRVPGVTSPEENGVFAAQRLASGAESTAFADFQVLLRIDPPQQATTDATPRATPPPPPEPRTDTGETTVGVTVAQPPPATTSEIPTTPADTETTSPTASPPAEGPGAGDEGVSWRWPALFGALVAVAAAAALAIGRARRGS